MGEVWAAHDPRLCRTVAIKLLRDPGEAAAVAMFRRETRAAAALNHPGIATVYDLGQDHDGTLFLAMEHLRGRDLAAVLRDDKHLPVVDKPSVGHCKSVTHSKPPASRA